MHSVAKVELTDEEKALKKKQLEEKRIAYEKARDLIFKLRNSGELNDEILKITRKILEKIPDISTMWNIRRETLEKFLKQKTSESLDEIKKCDDLLSAELAFTEFCIMKDSKTYGIWYHRAWILEHMSQVDFANELALCEKLLQIDGRNFHCWDYRRKVAKMAAISKKDEYEFCNRMINANFSNYSAWHYRSSILPDLFHSSGDLRLREDIVLDEIKRLKNAFFTDPEDQSSWIYAEWLSSSNKIQGACEIMNLVFDSNDGNCSAICTLTQAVNAEQVMNLIDFNCDDGCQFELFPVSIYPNSKCAYIFRIDFHSKPSILRIRNSIDEDFFNISIQKNYVNTNAIYRKYEIEAPILSDARRFMLEDILSSCKELLKELSPEEHLKMAKWPIYTCVHCLKELDHITNHNEILSNLNLLGNSLDTMHHKMYDDLAEILRVNEFLRRFSSNGIRLIDDIIAKERTEHCHRFVNMSLKSLSHLKFIGGFIRNLDLSSNLLCDLSFTCFFGFLTHLVIDDNPVQRLHGLYVLKKLEYLSIARTLVASVKDITSIFQLPSLKRFVFCETALAENDEETRELFRLVKNRGLQLRLICHWL